MKYSEKEIKKGIKLHYIKTNKFKTDLVSVLLTTPLKKETVTKNALIVSVLRRGSKKRPSMDQISIELENMYGAEFDCGIEKLGDNHILKFYLESVNDNYIPKETNLLKQNIEIILELVLNPLVENDGFLKEYIEQEKQNVKQLIEGKIDDKDQYAFDRCVEEMYKNKPHGLYRYGYIEDLEKLDEKNLYEYYRKLIGQAKIDIFISGEFNEKEIEEYITELEYVKNLEEREGKHICDLIENEQREVRSLEESMDVSQGKLVIGLKIDEKDTSNRFVSSIYNAILGGSANSKLFQNVREKESLAYTVGSRFVKQKNNIYIKSGIEIENYKKALEVIEEQIEAMKKGDFTEEDMKNAKIFLAAGVKMLEDEQDMTITYYIGQELSNSNQTLEQYLEEIEKVTKEQVVDIANKTNIDTIYFLRNN